MSFRILVLLSAYNGEKYIRAQILSILSQETDSSIFIRVRDDGSNDGTCAVVEQLMREYPGRIELIRGENIGCIAAFLELIRHAEGYDYYALCDQDDVWLPDKIASAVEYLEKEDDSVPLLYACTSSIVWDDLVPRGMTRRCEKPLTPRNTIIQNICPGHNQIMNNALLRLVSRDTDPSMIYVHDFWITNIAALYGKVLFDNTPHALYRQHAGNLFGYGQNPVSQLFTSFKRLKGGDSRILRAQMAYFAKLNPEELERQGLYDEIRQFTEASSLAERFRIYKAFPFYRQSDLETKAIKLLYLAGLF